MSPWSSTSSFELSSSFGSGGNWHIEASCVDDECWDVDESSVVSPLQEDDICPVGKFEMRAI